VQRISNTEGQSDTRVSAVLSPFGGTITSLVKPSLVVRSSSPALSVTLSHRRLIVSLEYFSVIVEHSTKVRWYQKRVGPSLR
jgi:hypothetical protein